MKSSVISLIVIVAVVALCGIWVASAYNGIIALDEQVAANFAQIDNQLKRRVDTIPDLIKVVNKYAAHEKEVIDSVSNARAKLAGATTIEEKTQANASLDSAVSRLLAISENYPDLKANQEYSKLMDEMAGTENRIAVARRDYNESVKEYNVKIKTFPTVLIKGLAGAEEKSFFEIEESEREKPDYEI